MPIFMEEVGDKDIGVGKDSYAPLDFINLIIPLGGNGT